MSFVSIASCKDYMSVMADSRSSEIYKDGRFHKVLSEDVNKIITISRHSFYAITGIVEHANEFIENSKMVDSIIDKNGIIKSSKDINKWFFNSVKYMDYSNSFGLSIGGKTSDEKFGVYSFESDKKVINESKCDETEFKYELSIPKNTDSELIDDKFKELYNYFYNGTYESMLQIQQILNDYVADVSPTVNKICKYFVILK